MPEHDSTNNAALTTASNYVIAPSVSVSSVTRINATTVDLTLAARLPASSGTVTANFNLPPTTGVSDAAGWSVTPVGPGSDVQVTAVNVAGTVATLTVWPPVLAGSTISVACPTAANATGLIG